MELIFFFLYFCMCAHIAMLAMMRGRSGLVWFTIGFFFSFFGYVVLLLPPVSKK